MTTDATRSNVEQWHIAPQVDRKPAELESDTARRQLEAYQAKQLDTQRARLGDGMAPLPQQPTVISTHVVDLRPLVEWWQSQEQRLRDQVAVERTAASSAREALAACEERLRQSRMAAEEGMLEHDRMRRDLDLAHEARLAALGEANRYAVERDNALADLERERARFERSLSELRSSATEQTVSLVPGSVPAVIEAYRLLVGDSLKWSRQFGWHDYTECDDKRLSEATLQLIHWLDVYAPVGKQ